MKDIHIHLKDGSPEYIKVKDKNVPIEAFLLTTSVTNRNAGHFLAYGNTDTIGTMLYNLWKWSVHESPELAETIECVAKDITGEATKARGAYYEYEDDGNGLTH